MGQIIPLKNVQRLARAVVIMVAVLIRAPVVHRVSIGMVLLALIIQRLVLKLAELGMPQLIIVKCLIRPPVRLANIGAVQRAQLRQVHLCIARAI